MNYQSSLATIPKEFTDDALWKMEVYRLALFVGDIAWPDVTRLMQDRRMLSLSDQLYRAVGSVSANYSEGYSRSSRKDQVRFYEYALGSARETRGWYWKGRHVLGEAVALYRIQILTHIARHLLNIIPAGRGYTLREEPPPYLVANEASPLEDLLTNVPWTSEAT